jgi:hypothetical protein
MTKEEAVERLLAVLPEFAPYYDESDGRPSGDWPELLLHVVMGDLARFYMERGRRDHDLAARYWRVVEELAAEGGDEVENAVWVSLIEWFAHGSPAEQRALVDADPLQGPKTKAIRAHYP